MSNPSSPNPSNRLSVWFVLLAAIGFPSAAGLTFARTITQHPLQAVGIALLYEIAVLLISIVTGVWQQLYNDWVKQIATWIDGRLGMFNYQRDYFKQLHNKYKAVSTRKFVSGMPYSLELEQVYIAPQLASTPSDQVSPNPIKVPKSLRSGSHPVWDYLTSEPSTHQHLVILGAPGSGKSTLLQNMVLALASRKIRRQRPASLYKLPFLLSLHKFSDKLKDNPSFSLADAVREVSYWQREVPQGWVEDRLARKHCLILLDGLDEIVNQENRQQMVNWIQNQIDIYGHKNCFIVTSRPFGYSGNHLDNVMILEIQEFNFARIKAFIDQWYYAYYRVEAMHSSQKDQGVRVRADEDAHDLLERLKNTPALLDLARNPLLLTMMVIIHKVGGALPGNRADLYKKMCQVFLESYTRWEFPSGQKQKVLEYLACYMMKAEIEEIEPTEAGLVIIKPLTYVSMQITPEAFLQIVEKDGIWIEGGQPGSYRFIHKTFGEYLTAMYIRENKQEQILIEKIGSSQWHETIFLYCTTGDATPIMSACLKDNHLLAGAIGLALDLELHGKKISALPEVRKQFTHVLGQAIEDEDAESRHKWAKALLTRRIQDLDHRASLYNDETHVIDTSLITCAEYQLFLDEQYDHGHNYWPDHWNNNRFLHNQGFTPILGVRPSDSIAFCNWLTEQNSSDIWHYRLPKRGELEEADKQLGKISRMSTENGYWISDDAHFIWVNEQKSLANVISAKQLQDAFKKDQERQDYYLNNRPNDSILHESVTLANVLLNFCNIHRKLIDALTDVCKQILVCKHILQAEIKKFQQEIQAIQRKIKAESEQDAPRSALQRKESTYQTELAFIQLRLSTFQGQFEEAEKSAHIVSVQLAREHKRFFLFKDKNREQSIQEQLQKALQPVDEIQRQIERLQQQKNELKKRIEDIARKKTQRQSKPSNNTDLQDRLRQTEQNVDQCKADMKCLDTIHNICNHALTFSLAYGVDNTTNVLDLDHVFNIIKDETFKKALEDAPAYASDFAFTFADSLAQDIASYYKDCTQIKLNNQDQIKISEVVATLTQIQKLTGELTSKNYSKSIQELAYYLFECLKDFSKEENRSAERNKRLLRWYIRYFARVLAHHLQYWWWEDLPTRHILHPFNKSQQEHTKGEHIIDAYLDIYIAFTILENRIDNDTYYTPCEGILLVKEFKE